MKAVRSDLPNEFKALAVARTLVTLSLLAATVLIAVATFSQSVAQQAVSDSTAYRFIFLSLSLPDNPSPTDVRKRDLKFGRFRMDASDYEALKTALAIFHREYTTWQGGLAETVSPIANGAALASQRDEMVQRYRIMIRQMLSAPGWAAFEQYVVSEKQKMRP